MGGVRNRVVTTDNNFLYPTLQIRSRSGVTEGFQCDAKRPAGSWSPTGSRILGRFLFVQGGTMASVAEQRAAGTRARPLKIGLLGIGVGAGEVIPAMDAMEEVDLFAAADVVPATRELFKGRYPETRV